MKVYKSFGEWVEDRPKVLGRRDLNPREAWDAACASKQAEIDQLKDANDELWEYLADIGEIDHYARWCDNKDKFLEERFE